MIKHLKRESRLFQYLMMVNLSTNWKVLLSGMSPFCPLPDPVGVHYTVSLLCFTSCVISKLLSTCVCFQQIFCPGKLSTHRLQVLQYREQVREQVMQRFFAARHYRTYDVSCSSCFYLHCSLHLRFRRT